MSDHARPAAGERRPTATDEFFAALAEHPRQPLLKTASGTLRFDLVDEQDHEDHWYVTLRDGELDVSRSAAPADAVLRLERRTFDGMASGTVNFLTTILRGQLMPQGDLGLVVLFQRLFPGPPASAGRPATSRSTPP